MEYVFTCFAALIVLLVVGAYIGSKLGPSGKKQRQRKPPAHVRAKVRRSRDMADYS